MPNPNREKSYFTGSFLSNILKFLSNSIKLFISFCFLLIRPSFLATLPECRSKGQDSFDFFIFFHIPKSTFLSSLTTHLKKHVYSFAT